LNEGALNPVVRMTAFLPLPVQRCVQPASFNEEKNMMASKYGARMACAILITTAVGAVAAQTYPSRPIRVVTAQPGGGTDIAMRVVAPELSRLMGQQVIVDNRGGGGGGAIAADIVLGAQPDGHTLLFYTSALWLAPYLHEKINYDPVKSFSPVILIVNSPSVLAVHSSVPAKSVKELVALARAKPGVLNYGSGGPGTAPHLMAEMFKQIAGVDVVRVSYKGVGFAVTDLAAGQIQMVFVTAGAVDTHVRSGRVRLLGVTGSKPSALTPGVPPIADTLPGYEATAKFGLLAPARTPAAIVKRLNSEIVKVLARPDVRERFVALGTEIQGGTPEEFAAIIKAEMNSMGKVIKAAGIKGE
jgi:tripartite-type tricarboxylate transporter receptor subunit TctC